ncbi:hypothetical protein NBRC10512_000315 [Rhodotorula toruloides]|uniref:RHTO0S11e00298g1_1 n=2 Tax=Rhodotorula toruloides TaxID=5286 RepID=A0A061B659_RHOTO|nr:uncharacterized protein RHTO_03770 [Rhodotorula toruloides NP11]EMS19972.1 hypothetical protein RHTO_03770 [Rhodotorula toruloides NP11]CDR45446.1 RHTO0S11e00298g1_1 [Rhodotorula toruloides]
MTALPNSRTTKGSWNAQRGASGPFAEPHIPLLNEFGALSGQAQASLKQAAGVPCVEPAYVPDAELHKLTEDALRGVVLKPVFDALLALAGNHHRLEDLIKLHEAQAASLAAEEEANECAILAATEELCNRLLRRTGYLQKYVGEEASIAMAQEIQDTVNEVKSSRKDSSMWTSSRLRRRGTATRTRAGMRLMATTTNKTGRGARRRRRRIRR